MSIRGGIENAPKMARELGCEVMQIFSRPPQGGSGQELTPEVVKNFKLRVTRYGLHDVYIHAPYYINLASTDNRIRYGSISAIRTELERASLLGAKYVMTHLGSAKEMENAEAIKKVIEGLEKVLDGYNGSAKLLIENSAGAGKIIGADIKEIEEILSKIKSPALAGICLDTQHGFASGYDWKSGSINFKNIKLIHANDSATDLGSRKDRHEHIGKGKIGMEGFAQIAAFAKKQKNDLICETDYPEVTEDIKILKKLISSR
ncbi:MAG: deoxyribonuclease IV [Candidatus Paceibacterota bacterium]